jgi:hypothetical protein
MKALFYVGVIFFIIGMLEFSEFLIKRNHKIEIEKSIANAKFKRAYKRAESKNSILEPVKLDLSIDSLSSDTTQLVEKEDLLKKDNGTSLMSGSLDSTTFYTFLANYRSQVLEAKKDTSKQSKLVIRYYTKAKDKNKVFALRKLGYYIHERNSEASDEYPSNSICYGDSVSKEDLMLIAYTLIEKGVALQDISLSKFHDTWKSNSIEIGTDTTIMNKSVINLTDLQSKWKDM